MSTRGKLVAFVGPHNSGKTGLVESLARLASRRGLRVGVIKRAAQPLSFEPAGKDSARFARAGATRVVTHGPGLIFMSEPVSTGFSARELAQRFGRGIDLWLVENFATEPVPWIAVIRKGEKPPAADRRLLAVVGPSVRGLSLPHFSPRATGRLLAFLTSHFEL